jgi:hypothetical protein
VFVVDARTGNFFIKLRNILILMLLCDHNSAYLNSMAIKQLYLCGFSHHLCGSRLRRAASSLLGTARELGGLSKLAGGFFPGALLATAPNKRERDFPLFVTFWAFFSQVLTRNASCRAALASVQAWCVARRKQPPSNGTGAYCQARSRLPLECLRSVFAAVNAWMERRNQGECGLLNGRPVRVIDGTGLSMPDSEDNRKKWPCAGNQKKGGSKNSFLNRRKRRGQRRTKNALEI